ncbi:hypothetical protein ACSBR2_000550 [Camellia fascicularis]
MTKKNEIFGKCWLYSLHHSIIVSYHHGLFDFVAKRFPLFNALFHISRDGVIQIIKWDQCCLAILKGWMAKGYHRCT